MSFPAVRPDAQVPSELTGHGLLRLGVPVLRDLTGQAPVAGFCGVRGACWFCLG
jgi:hypothetical protein